MGHRKWEVLVGFFPGKGLHGVSAMTSEPARPGPAAGFRDFFLVYAFALAARTYYYFQVSTHYPFVKYPYFGLKASLGLDLGNRVLDLSPLYLGFWTLWTRLFGVAREAATIFQLGLGTVNALLILAVGRRYVGPRAALAGALLYAFHGNAPILEALFEPLVFEVFFGLLFLLFLDAAARALRSQGRAMPLALAAGLSAGLAAITKPNFLPTVLLASLWLARVHENGAAPRTRGKAAGALFLSACLVVSVVTVRNALRFHDFILVTADLGKVFHHGNGPGADGTTSAADPRPVEGDNLPLEPDAIHELFRLEASRQAGRPLSPSQASRFWTRKTLDFMLSRPGHSLEILGRKALLFFTDYEIHLTAQGYGEYKRSPGFPLARFGFISALGILGMVLRGRRWRALFPLYGLVGNYLVSGVVLVASSRYRGPAVPALCLFAGCGLVFMLDALRARRFRALAFSFLAAATLWTLASFGARNMASTFETRGIWPLAPSSPEELLRLEEARKSGNLGRDGPISPAPGPGAPGGIPGPGR